MRCWCGRETKLDEVAQPRTHVHEDPEAPLPWMYLLYFECGCGTTRTLCLWQDEECTAEELAFAAHEQAGADLCWRDVPADHVSRRGFSQPTHELAARGL